MAGIRGSAGDGIVEYPLIPVREEPGVLPAAPGRRGVGITIAAPVRAGRILPDIPGHDTPAGGPLAGIFQPAIRIAVQGVPGKGLLTIGIEEPREYPVVGEFPGKEIPAD